MNDPRDPIDPDPSGDPADEPNPLVYDPELAGEPTTCGHDTYYRGAVVWCPDCGWLL